MKRIILGISMIVLAAQTSFAARGYISVRDRKELTCYEKLVEKGDAETSFYLECIGDGDLDCKFSDGHIPADHVVLIGSIEEHIISNITAGEVSGTGQSGNASYSWQYTDQGCTTQITIFD